MRWLQLPIACLAVWFTPAASSAPLGCPTFHSVATVQSHLLHSQLLRVSPLPPPPLLRVSPLPPPPSALSCSVSRLSPPRLDSQVYSNLTASCFTPRHNKIRSFLTAQTSQIPLCLHKLLLLNNQSFYPSHLPHLPALLPPPCCLSTKLQFCLVPAKASANAPANASAPPP